MHTRMNALLGEAPMPAPLVVIQAFQPRQRCSAAAVDHVVRFTDQPVDQPGGALASAHWVKSAYRSLTRLPGWLVEAGSLAGKESRIASSISHSS